MTTITTAPTYADRTDALLRMGELAIRLVESIKDNTHVTDRLSDRELRLLDRYDAAYSDMQAITNSQQSVASCRR